MNEIESNIDYASSIIIKNSEDLKALEYLLNRYTQSLSYMDQYIKRNKKHSKIVELCAVRDAVRDRYIPKCEETIDILEKMNKSAKDLLNISNMAKMNESMSRIVSGPGNSTVGYMHVEDRIREMRRKSHELRALADLRMSNG